MTEIRIVREANPDPTEVRRLQDAIDDFNIAVTGRSDWGPVAIFLRDAKGAVLGGLTGMLWAGWIHVTVLWVDEPLRRQGLGSRLMAEVEAFAVEKGCQAIFLETFSFQAPDFYRRLGFEEFGRLDGYPEGHTQHFFCKRLATDASRPRNGAGE